MTKTSILAVVAMGLVTAPCMARAGNGVANLAASDGGFSSGTTAGSPAGLGTLRLSEATGEATAAPPAEASKETFFESEIRRCGGLLDQVKDDAGIPEAYTAKDIPEPIRRLAANRAMFFTSCVLGWSASGETRVPDVR